MERASATAERKRTGGHVELVVHRQRDVQEERQECGSAVGDHNRGMHGVRTGIGERPTNWRLKI